MRQIALYGKGGIGKSTVASHLSFTFAERGLTVLQMGCSPKNDSTYLLLPDFPPTILDVLRKNDFMYDDLSPEDKLIVRDAAQAAQNTWRGASSLFDALSIDRLKEKGMQIYTLNKSENREFQKLARQKCIDWLKTKVDSSWVDEFLEEVKKAEIKLGYR